VAARGAGAKYRPPGPSEVKEMRFLTLSLVLGGLMGETSSAMSLEYPATCRGASAVVTDVSGLDTTTARITARHTYPDAVSYCHYSLGNGAGKQRPSTAAVTACAEKFMRDLGPENVLRAEANCQLGTLSTSSAKWSNAYKLPLPPTCGGDNVQAISLFRTLCPSYEGKIEAPL
jgi:hypothetical protein